MSTVPLIVEEATLEVENVTCSQLTEGTKGFPFTAASNCQKTLGDELDPLLMILQIVFGVAACFLMRVHVIHTKKAREEGNVQHFSIGIFSALSMFFFLVGLIDPQSFRGTLHPWMYYICDEISASFVLSCAVLVMDSVVKVGRSFESSKITTLSNVTGLPINAIRTAHAFFIITHPVLIVMALAMPESFLLFTGIKGFIGGLTMLVVMVVFTVMTRKIMKHCVEMNLDAGKLKVLRKKFGLCYKGGFITSMMLLIAASLDVTAETYTFKSYSGFDGIFFWIIFRVLFLGAFLIFSKNNRPQQRKSKKVRDSSTVVSETSDSSS